MDQKFGLAVRTREPLEQLVIREDLERIYAALATLSEKDQRIITMRYGLSGRRVHSPAQVAVAQRLSPQHAETIISGARVRLLAAMAMQAEASRMSSETSSPSTSKTLTTLPSHEVSHTEASQTKSERNVARSQKTA